jgi:UDP-N-acetylglucosamine 2-epimerase (non-hydrolysing)
VPCLTLRQNTERPITVTHGTNRVVGTDPERILAAFEEWMVDPPEPRCPALWDGHAGARIATLVDAFLS